MEDADAQTRAFGKALVFSFVILVSGLLLWAAVHLIVHRRIALGCLALLGSALFWWPLFKLGRYHARRH